MKIKFIRNFFFLFFMSIYSLGARPISYPGGWTVMQMNDFNSHSLHVHYTLSPKYSFGYRGEYWRKKDWQFHGGQFNYLIKRLNNPKSQANLYFKSGLGLALSDFRDLKNKTEPAFFSGLSFDWEDRRYFTKYENRIHYSPEIDKFFIQKGRIGIAPYIGNYGDLHTWLMLQVDHMPKEKNKIVYTPMLRFFKADYLAEIGRNNIGDLLFNFVKRF